MPSSEVVNLIIDKKCGYICERTVSIILLVVMTCVGLTQWFHHVIQFPQEPYEIGVCLPFVDGEAEGGLATGGPLRHL